MNAVSPHKVTASVRTDGAIGAFHRRVFDLMLSPGSATQQAKEAIRILRQIGLETRGVAIQQPKDTP